MKFVEIFPLIFGETFLLNFPLIYDRISLLNFPMISFVLFLMMYPLAFWVTSPPDFDSAIVPDALYLSSQLSFLCFEHQWSA